MGSNEDAVPPSHSEPRQNRSLASRYLFAHAGKTLFWTASDLYFVFYMNKVCGIAPIVTGFIVGASILLAALADYGIGRTLGSIIRTAPQAGRLQLAGGIGAAITLTLFASTAFLDAAWRLPACITSLLLFRLAYALIDVPQNTLMSFVPGTARELSMLVAGRNIAGGVCKIALATAFVPIMRGDAPVEVAPRFLWLVAIIAIIAIIGFALLAARLSTQEVSVSQGSEPEHSEIGGHLIRMAATSVMLTGFTQLQPYIAIDVIHGANAATTFLTTIAAGNILSQPMCHWRASIVRERIWTEVLWSTVLAALCISLMPLDMMSASITAGLICGLATGGMLFALWTDFAESLSGDDTFFAYARFTASAKMGQGLAIIAIGSWLQLSGTATVFPWSVGLRWIAAATLILGAVILALVPTHDRRHLRTKEQSR